MQIYEYKCELCGKVEQSTHRGDHLGVSVHNSLNHDSLCGGRQKRVWAVSIQRPVMPHFNTFVQQEVTGNRDFAEKLKRKGAEYTERTGIETNYQPVDPSYIASKVDGTGLDSQNRARVAAGKKEIVIPGA